MVWRNEEKTISLAVPVPGGPRSGSCSGCAYTRNRHPKNTWSGNRLRPKSPAFFFNLCNGDSKTEGGLFVSASDRT